MQDSETECTQSFSLSTDCKNLMNPQYWSSLLSVQAGQATNSQSVKVDVSSIYTYSQATNTYSVSATTSAAASTLTPTGATQATSGTCSCSGMLKEAHYTVKVAQQP